MTGLALPRLEGKVAFVAGASRGIGRNISLALAKAGAAVAVAARTESPGPLPGTIHSVAKQITTSGGTALAVRCDVTDEASVGSAVDLVARELGGIDVLVANAGVMWLAPTLETPLKRWELTLRVNLTGVFLVTRAALPHIMTRASGSLIAVTTDGVRMIDRGANAYWVSKAAVERYYTGLAAELAPSNVAVNCLAPSKVVLTEGWEAAGRASGLTVPADMVEEPEAMGSAAVWLAAQEPASAGLTGTIQYSLDLLERLGAGA
ncbi:MAG: SDR family NAD(P)-dependent oxidoreductase [Acidimicrobiales bacterium]